MCDACNTTLFNYQRTYAECGYVVCIDCYKEHKEQKDDDDSRWLDCTDETKHDVNKLRLTQIIAGNSLAILNERIYLARDLWEISQQCACTLVNKRQPDAELKKNGSAYYARK